MQTVEATYRFGDIFAMLMQNWRRYLRLLLIAEVFWILLMVGTSMLDGWPLMAALRYLDWFTLVFFGVVLIVALLTLCPWVIYARLKKRGFLGPNRFEFAEKGIKANSPASESVLFWSAIQRIVATPRHMFLFISPGSGLILPRRAFADDAEFSAWVAEARRRQSKAKSKV